MRNHKSVLHLLAAITLGVGVGPASAQVVTFVDLNDQPVLVLDDGNFGCGITSTASVEHAHVVACVNTGVSGIPEAAGLVYLVEPSTAPFPGSISDIIQIVVAHIGGGAQYQVTLDFTSDNENDPPSYPTANAPVLVEDGTPQLLNNYFRDSGGDGFSLPGNMQVYAQSDVGDPPTQVQRTSWAKVKIFYR